MPFEIKMTADQVIAKLKALYGTEFTAADIKAFCAMNDITYQTVTRKLQQYKVSKGKWNLEVTQESVQQIENSFAAPAVMPITEKNLVPTVDNTFVKFGHFTDVKKVVILSISIDIIHQRVIVVIIWICQVCIQH